MFLRFFRRCLLFSLLMAVVLVALSALPPSPRESSFLLALRDKHQLLEDTPSPRVVVVGGSNVAFGMNSVDLSQRLEQRVVNIGLHAGLGLKFMLRDLRPFLRQGDRVLVIPEYEHFQPGSRAQSALACVLLDVDPSGWRCLSIGEKVSMLRTLTPYVCRKGVYWCEVFGNRLLERTIQESGLEIYNRTSFNGYGDVTIHWEKSPGTFVPHGKPQTNEINQSVLDFLQAYFEDLAGDGIKMELVPPVLQASSFDNMEVLIRHLATDLEDRGIGFVCDPRRYRLDASEYFFDTPYHLSKKGIDLRMRMLAADLQAD